jgi:hypothetical protein
MLYKISDGELVFIMGVDNKTGDLTDFGGGRKLHERVEEAAVREYTEETYDSFVSLIPSDLSNDYCLYTGRTIVILHKYTGEIGTSINEFNRKCSTESNPEIRRIYTCDVDRLIRICKNKSKNRIMFSRIRKLFYSQYMKTKREFMKELLEDEPDPSSIRTVTPELHSDDEYAFIPIDYDVSNMQDRFNVHGYSGGRISPLTSVSSPIIGVFQMPRSPGSRNVVSPLNFPPNIDLFSSSFGISFASNSDYTTDTSTDSNDSS